MDLPDVGGLGVAVLGKHTHPQIAPILLGPTTRERACRVLEQQLGAVWTAVLESHGFSPAEGWRVTLEGLGLLLEPGMGHGPPDPPSVAPGPVPNGRTPDADQ
jgi:hypothetical protein